MDFKKKMRDFNKRWSIDDSTDYKEEFRKFKERILNLFNGIDLVISHSQIELFCNILGIKNTYSQSALKFDEFPGSLINSLKTDIINSLKKENNSLEFYRILQIIFLLEFSSGYKKEYLTKLREAIDLSEIKLALMVKKGEVILYPEGEKELDQKLVNEVLSFLDDKSDKHFKDALHYYQKKKQAAFIKSAESLRRALEEYLRYILQNRKGLKENIKEIGNKLKAQGKDSKIRTIIFQTFNYLDDYFNENSKHKDGNITEPENEFLIYQTGLLMRYISRAL